MSLSKLSDWPGGVTTRTLASRLLMLLAGFRTELARVHSSSKARAALQQQDEHADVLAMSKGWINFYLMKEHGDAEEGVTEDAAPGTIRRRCH